VGSLKVDIDALLTLKQRCQEMYAAFDDAGHDTIMGFIDQVGTDPLHDGFSDFEGHWSDGRKKVKRHLEGLVERLSGAIDQYQHTEADLVSQMDKSQQGGS
jgi:hypothetical protein